MRFGVMWFHHTFFLKESGEPEPLLLHADIMTLSQYQTPIYFVLRSMKPLWKKSVYQQQDSTGRTGFRLTWWDDVSSVTEQLPVCSQGSGPLHGLGQGRGAAIRLLHIRSVLL